jgi:cAMP-dependent protein kinase regulator
MEEKREYLESKIKPVMENLVFQLLSERPDNPALFMINWLQKTGGYTQNGLTIEEKRELEQMRKEVKQYREMEGNDGEHMITEEDDEEDLDKHNEIENKKKNVQGKGPRTGVSAEAYGKFNKKENFVPRSIKKNESQIQRIKSRILQSFLFGNLEAKDVSIVIGAMEEKTFKSGETVITQGDYGDCLFVVESGDLDCYKKFSKDSEARLVKQCSAGDSFGELALLYNAPRAATVVAKTDCILWALDRETFNNIVKDAASKKRERYENFLKSVEILSSVDAYELSQISDALKSCSYKEGDYVIKEGELGDVFYIIEEGQAVATKVMEAGKAPEIVKEYNKGQYFGELALIKGEPRAASVLAKVFLIFNIF